MNKIWITFLLMTIGLNLNADDSKNANPVDLLTFRQIDALCPWLQAGNAAGLSQMPGLFPAGLELGYGRTNGNFHSVFQGDTNDSFHFDSKSYRKINRTFLFGAFEYQKSSEKRLNYSNTNEPQLNYPYLLADTIGNDTYTREFFNLSGTIASPVSNKIDWGLNFKYQVGEAAQNRDPRAENKVVQASVSPGLLFKADHFRVGANLGYGYYNEDIDVSVVEEGAQHILFQMHGPGVFNYHTSSSFYRLYQQHTYGGGMQLEWKNDHVSNIMYSGYDYSVQTIDDGRRASTATWAAVKNDSRLDGANWKLTDVFSIVHGTQIHQIKAVLDLKSRVGSEFIQRLEKIGVTDLEHWITYGREQKYYSLQTNAGLNYQRLLLNENNNMKSLLQTGLGYFRFNEKYYLPNYEIICSNLIFDASYLDSFTFRQAQISAEMNFLYQFNMKAYQNLSIDNFMVQKIYMPQFNYLTSDYLSPGVSLSCQFPVKKMTGKYFIKTDFRWLHSTNGSNRTIVNIGTGIIF